MARPAARWRPGESAVARTEIEHGYRNEGTAPLVFTMTVAELPS
ncbi:transcriptional regulator, XRE family [Klebsiella pneumoniae IS53]|nr:transcriptional regulator, XRE family [Klebsiella pneumoniae IS53]